MSPRTEKAAAATEPTPVAFMRPDGIAKRCSVSRRTVTNWIRSGHLPAMRMGERCTLIAVADADAFLEKFKTGLVTP